MSRYSAVGLYVRVRVRPDDGSKPFTVILRDPTEATTDMLGTTLSGIEVDREGDDVHGATFHERRYMISTSLITKRTPLAMDNHTGLLVKAPTEGDA